MPDDPDMDDLLARHAARAEEMGKKARPSPSEGASSSGFSKARQVSANAGAVHQVRLAKSADDVAKAGINKKDAGWLSGVLGRKWRSSGMLLNTTTGQALVAIRQRGESLTAREKLFLLVNEPVSSAAAYWFGRVLQLCLVLSALATTYETVGFVNEATGPGVWILVKIAFNVIFSIEAVLRIVSYIPCRAVHRSSYVWLDIATTVRHEDPTGGSSRLLLLGRMLLRATARLAAAWLLLAWPPPLGRSWRLPTAGD